MASRKPELEPMLIDLTDIGLRDLGECTEPELLESIESLTAEAGRPEFAAGRLANNAADDPRC